MSYIGTELTVEELTTAESSDLIGALSMALGLIEAREA